jgi:hypothetical protein
MKLDPLHLNNNQKLKKNRGYNPKTLLLGFRDIEIDTSKAI